MGLVLRLVRVFLVHRLDFEQREETLLFFGRPDLARDQVAGLQVKPANLGGRDIDVLRAGEVIEALGAQEAEAFGQDFQHALREEHPGALGILLEDVEDHLVLAHRAEVLDAQLARHLVQLGHGHRLQLGDVDRRGGDAVFVLLRGGFGLGLFRLGRFYGFGGRLQCFGGGLGHRHRRGGGFGCVVADFGFSNRFGRLWFWPS